jgi:hypothetical protein
MADLIAAFASMLDLLQNERAASSGHALVARPVRSPHLLMGVKLNIQEQSAAMWFGS